jgi:hypothetical protein
MLSEALFQQLQALLVTPRETLMGALQERVKGQKTRHD